MANWKNVHSHIIYIVMDWFPLCGVVGQKKLQHNSFALVMLLNNLSYVILFVLTVRLEFHRSFCDRDNEVRCVHGREC